MGWVWKLSRWKVLAQGLAGREASATTSYCDLSCRHHLILLLTWLLLRPPFWELPQQPSNI